MRNHLPSAVDYRSPEFPCYFGMRSVTSFPSIFLAFHWGFSHFLLYEKSFFISTSCLGLFLRCSYNLLLEKSYYSTESFLISFVWQKISWGSMSKVCLVKHPCYLSYPLWKSSWDIIAIHPKLPKKLLPKNITTSFFHLHSENSMVPLVFNLFPPWMFEIRCFSHFQI